jgi:hypothetical protein
VPAIDAQAQQQSVADLLSRHIGVLTSALAHRHIGVPAIDAPTSPIDSRR